MKVACLHFVRVKSFCKKGLKLSLMTSFVLLLYYHNLFLSSQSFSIITIIFYYDNLFPLSQYLSMITILFDYHYLYENKLKYEFHHLTHIFYRQNMTKIFCQFHKFLIYVFYFEFFSFFV